jgi:Domain of unknown function (DUF4160)
MFYNDHEPPHFHAIYGEYRASVRIEPIQIIEGELPGRAQRLVFEWAEIHRDDLNENWRRAREHARLEPIAPLD